MALRRAPFLAFLAIWHFTVLASSDENTELQPLNEKRYIAALAKNGRLPMKSQFQNEGKREGEEALPSPMADESQHSEGEESDPDVFFFNDDDSRSRDTGPYDKRYFGAFLKSRGMPHGTETGDDQVPDKRYFGAFLKSRGMPHGSEQAEEQAADKRYLGAFLNSRGMPRGTEPMEDEVAADKRFVGAFFNSRGKPVSRDDIEEQEADKRNIATMARKGWLSAIRSYRSPPGRRITIPRRYSTYNDKRDDSLYSDEPKVITADDEDCIEEPDTEQDMSSLVGKRNIAYLARNGMLPPRRSFSDPFSLKRNRPSFLPNVANNRWPNPSPKRQQPVQLRLIKLKSRRCAPSGESKRNVAAMARKGLLPEKKSVASMARKGLLPGSSN